MTEGGAAVLGRGALRAFHPALMPGSIRYAVVAAPQWGSLVLERPAATANPHSPLIAHSAFYVHAFTQFDVDSNALQYIHSGAKHPRSEFSLASQITGTTDEMFVKFGAAMITSVTGVQRSAKDSNRDVAV